MSTLSIVAISCFSVLFLLLLLAAASILVYTNLLVRRQVSTLTLTITTFETNINATIARVEGLITKVHGQEITVAVKQFLEALPVQARTATRIERGFTALDTLVRQLVSEEGLAESSIERARESGLEPESYAPAAPGERYTSRSRTALGDEADLDEESSANSFQDLDQG
jgi:hypothetical protein